jgi:hypothetical protein
MVNTTKINRSLKVLSYIVKCLLTGIGFGLVIEFIETASVVKWSEFLATDPEFRVRFLALPDFLRSSGYGKGPTQPREYN